MNHLFRKYCPWSREMQIRHISRFDTTDVYSLLWIWRKIYLLCYILWIALHTYVLKELYGNSRATNKSLLHSYWKVFVAVAILSVLRSASSTSISVLFLSMYFQMKVYKHKIVARFGLMHMVGTNLSVWLNVLVQETKHEILTFYDPENKTIGLSHRLGKLNIIFKFSIFSISLSDKL